MRRFPYVVLILATIATDFPAGLPCVLPLALAKDGAPIDHIALAMGGGAFASVIVSLPLGMLIDRIGRLVTIRASALVMGISLLGLAMTHGTLAAGLFLALLGFGGVANWTAELAYASELVSQEQSITMVALLGNVGNAAGVLVPVFAVWLWLHGVGRELFFYGAGSCVVGFALSALLSDTKKAPLRRRSRLMLLRSVWLPSMIFLVALDLQGGVNGSLAVLTFMHRGVANGGLIFMANALATFVFRYPAGRLVDRWGPQTMAIPVVIAQCIGCVAVAYAQTPMEVLLAGGLLGVAQAMLVPVGLSLFFEKSSPRTRGTAMGAYNFALALGTACGALLAALFTKVGLSYFDASLSCGAAAILAALCVVLPLIRKARQTAAYER